MSDSLRPHGLYRYSYLQTRNRDTDVEKNIWIPRGKGGDGMTCEIGIDIYTLLILYIKWITKENLLYAQATLLSSLWWPKWKRNPKKRGNVYTYGWFTVLYSRNEHNIVKHYTPIKIKSLCKKAKKTKPPNKTNCYISALKERSR